MISNAGPELLLLRTAAGEVCGVVNAARTLVCSCLRIWAHRTCARHALPRIIVLELRGNEFRGGNALVNPAIERANDVVFGIVLFESLLAEAAEGVRPRSSVAVIQARHHEQADKFSGCLPILLSNIVVILHSSHGRRRMIRPAVIENQFSAMGTETR